MNRIEIQAGTEIHNCFFASRDWKVLQHVLKQNMKGPFPIRFWQLFGFHDGRGFAFPAPVPRSRTELLDCGRWVMECLQPELGKVEFDYTKKIHCLLDEGINLNYPPNDFLRLDGSRVGLENRPGILELEIWEDDLRLRRKGVVDLRGLREFKLDNEWFVKIGKRYKGFPFGESFPALLKFLEEIDLEEVLVWNRHR